MGYSLARRQGYGVIWQEGAGYNLARDGKRGRGGGEWWGGGGGREEYSLARRRGV